MINQNIGHFVESSKRIEHFLDNNTMLMLWLKTAVGNTPFLADSSIQFKLNCLCFFKQIQTKFQPNKTFLFVLTRVAFELVALKDFQRIFTEISANSKAQQKHMEGVRGEQKKTMQNSSQTANTLILH